MENFEGVSQLTLNMCYHQENTDIFLYFNLCYYKVKVSTLDSPNWLWIICYVVHFFFIIRVVLRSITSEQNPDPFPLISEPLTSTLANGATAPPHGSSSRTNTTFVTCRWTPRSTPSFTRTSQTSSPSTLTIGQTCSISLMSLPKLSTGEVFFFFLSWWHIFQLKKMILFPLFCHTKSSSFIYLELCIRKMSYEGKIL